MVMMSNFSMPPCLHPSPPSFQAEENLGMAMMYTLATSAKEWLREKYGGVEEEEEEEVKEEVIEPHGLPVTVETFTEWRDRFEAEIALEKAKLLSDAALAASKEKRLTGRQWFVQKASKGIVVDEEEEAEEEEEEEIDFDDDDFDEGERDGGGEVGEGGGVRGFRVAVQ
ncbi:unnamed protein product [Closterium sp. Naga37s-1]|nr:unnamed protein product [Closterium sp. Naga37s-1]